MAKTVAKTTILPTEALRQGWLAYLGIYGFAYEHAKQRVETLTEKAGEFFGDLVAKGATVELSAQDVIADVRERTTSVYATSLGKARNFVPTVAANDRIKELEAEIVTLNKKVAAMNKKPATKTAAPKAAKRKAA